MVEIWWQSEMMDAPEAFVLLADRTDEVGLGVAFNARTDIAIFPCGREQGQDAAFQIIRSVRRVPVDQTRPFVHLLGDDRHAKYHLCIGWFCFSRYDTR